MHLRTTIQFVIKAAQNRIGLRSEFLQKWAHQAIGLLDERGQQMLAVDFLMIELLRNLLRRLQCLLSLDGEFVNPNHVRTIAKPPPLAKCAVSDGVDNCESRDSTA
jgi:hypothetical protein